MAASRPNNREVAIFDSRLSHSPQFSSPETQICILLTVFCSLIMIDKWPCSLARITHIFFAYLEAGQFVELGVVEAHYSALALFAELWLVRPLDEYMGASVNRCAVSSCAADAMAQEH